MSGRRTALAATREHPQGPVIEGRRVFWAEDYRNGSRIREVVLGYTAAASAAAG